MSSTICPECNQEWNEHWCKLCNLKHFQNDFNNWTSGNDKIDKFIQNAQQNVNNDLQVIEWIPYDRFKDVKQIGKGGFGTMHYARWIDGSIEKWDIENKQWKRYNKDVGVEVALKKFDNFVNFNDVLNEMEIHLKIYTKYAASIQFYGITQDLETLSYMMRGFLNLIRGGKSKSSTTPTTMNYKKNSEAICSSRLFNYSSLPKPRNDENFENELEELTKSTSV
ncbi:hypothetical protein Glove_86g115 [Diversispora epigaea]|uniref:Protein kinase domain-containing protein n=1 Tax=Diversispora epigaea TaxID=1348612 RepID=A0A397J8W4_9GLOM|nr:hypothetical protein Glove_86g115 [Diversispora epigaea]